MVAPGRPSRRLLLAGAIGNLAIASVWLVSRTVGLPLGPEAWEPEAIHVADIVATLDEVASAAGAH